MIHPYPHPQLVPPSSASEFGTGQGILSFPPYHALFLGLKISFQPDLPCFVFQLLVCLLFPGFFSWNCLPILPWNSQCDTGLIASPIKDRIELKSRQNSKIVILILKESCLKIINIKTKEPRWFLFCITIPEHIAASFF